MVASIAVPTQYGKVRSSSVCVDPDWEVREATHLLLVTSPAVDVPSYAMAWRCSQDKPPELQYPETSITLSAGRLRQRQVS